MKGQVSTPQEVVDSMVHKLFRKRTPKLNERVLDPGCGSGAFIEGILRWCEEKGVESPRIVGIESDSNLRKKAEKRVGSQNNVSLIEKDFLTGEFGFFDYVICNPPYVPIEELDKEEKKKYREIFHESARNRFDLYILFFEKALKHLKPSGRLVFITPEKFEYTLTAKPLRKHLANHHIEEIHHIAEDTFDDLVTYPTITTVVGEKNGKTTIRHRDGGKVEIELPSDGSRWISKIRESIELEGSKTLEDICVRISCGVATGRDSIFVMPVNEVPSSLEKYASPTVSGRELTKNGINSGKAMIIPYDKKGNLLKEEKLEDFLDWISSYKDELSSRYCVTEGGKEWYSFHENPPMEEILRSKILCKDITKEPEFWLDEEGDMVPRHNVYYIVPENPSLIPSLFNYLKTERVHRWLVAHCQRAANDFIRLQSSVLKKLPIPDDFIS